MSVSIEHGRKLCGGRTAPRQDGRFGHGLVIRFVGGSKGVPLFLFHSPFFEGVFHSRAPFTFCQGVLHFPPPKGVFHSSARGCVILGFEGGVSGSPPVRGGRQVPFLVL